MKFLYVYSRGALKDVTIPIVGAYVEALRRLGEVDLCFATRPDLLEGTADVAFLHYPAGIAFPGSKLRIRDLYARLLTLAGRVYVYTGNLEHTVVPEASTYGNSRKADLYIYPRMRELLSYEPPVQPIGIYVGHRRAARLSQICALGRAGLLGYVCGESWWKSAFELKAAGIRLLPPVHSDHVVETYRDFAGGIHVTEKAYDEHEIVCARIWEIVAACRPLLMSDGNPVHQKLWPQMEAWAVLKNLNMSVEAGGYDHERASNLTRKVVVDSGLFMTIDEMEEAIACATS